MPEERHDTPAGRRTTDEYAESNRIMWLMGLAAVVLFAALAAALAFIVRPRAPTIVPRRVRGNEAAVVAALRTYAGAQNIFHRTDYDSDGILEYAGPGEVGATGTHGSFTALYSTMVGGAAIELIAKEMAGAKYGAVGATPLGGYYFADLSEDCNSNAYNAAFTFGLCAVPAEHGVAGLNTFVIDVQGTVFQFDNGGKVLKRFPDTSDLSAEWVVTE